MKLKTPRYNSKILIHIYFNLSDMYTFAKIHTSESIHHVYIYIFINIYATYILTLHDNGQHIFTWLKL